MDMWLTIKEGNKRVGDFLKNCGYKKIAIYGMGMLGRHLLKDLSSNCFEYLYCIDRNADGFNLSIETFFSEDKLPEVDLIIVTTVHIYDDIVSMFREKENCKIVSLEALIQRLGDNDEK